MVGIRLNTSGQRKVQKQLFRKALGLQAMIKKNISEQKITDRGRLINSIFVEKNSDDCSVSVGAGVVYAGSIEFGTQPFTPPFDSIRGWVSRKLSVGEDEVDEVTWRVVSKISREGITPNPYFFSAVREWRQRL